MSTRSLTLVSLLTTLVSVLLAPAARANGRFPRAQRIVESTEDPQTLALYGTYGLVVTRDGGASFSHVCEAATGTYAGEDPLLEIFPGARLVLRTETGLVASGASFCDFSRLDAPNVDDITRDPTNPKVLLALTSDFDAVKGFSASVMESTDSGVTFGPKLPLPGGEIARGLSLDVVPSLPDHVLVTGLDSNGKGRLLTSKDRGKSWTGHTVSGTGSSSAPYLVAISADGNRVFYRTDTYLDVNGIDTAADALFVSVDGGTTFTQLIERRAKLFGVSLSADDSTLVVGYGDPVIAATYVEPEDIGIYRARVADLLADLPHADSHFTKIFAANTTCLRFTARGLLACSTAADAGFELGVAKDAEFSLADAKPFETLLDLKRLRPLACAPGTAGYSCYTDQANGFPAACLVFGAPCDASAPSSIGVPDASIGDGGTAGAASSSVGGSGGAAVSAGGSGNATTSGGTTGQGGAGTAGPRSEPSSCACRSTRTGTVPFPAALALSATALSALLLRRRAPRRGS